MKKLLDLILKKEKHEIPPIWIMRQAGRYLPEYRKIRQSQDNFLDFCYNPELASKVTLQPIERFDLDAAIIFSDILVIPDALGVDVKFIKGQGPKLSKTSNMQDLSKFKINKVNEFLNPVFENLKLTRQNLASNKTLIGFSGAPFTMACYMVEGGGSKNFDLVKRSMVENEEFFAKLIDILTESVINYLIKQIDSGADIVKIFDSWAGILPYNYYEKWVIEPTEKIIEAVKKAHPKTPIIAFAKNSGTSYINYAKRVKSDVIAIDQNISCEYIKNELQNEENLIIQGNLDNYILAYGSKDKIKESVDRILENFSEKPFIFNLGHGIIKDTPIENVEFLVKYIRRQL